MESGDQSTSALRTSNRHFRSELSDDFDDHTASQATQDDQPTQLNRDEPDWVPTDSQLDIISEGPTAWATLHHLTEHVLSKALMPNINVLCIGRVKNSDSYSGPGKEDLVIKTDHHNQLSISRKHCIIQRKGVGEDDFDPQREDGGDDFVRQMRRKATMPFNGQNGSEVYVFLHLQQSWLFSTSWSSPNWSYPWGAFRISLKDLSSNGTFINGKKCEPGKWTKLEHGDQVGVARLVGSEMNVSNDAIHAIVFLPC